MCNSSNFITVRSTITVKHLNYCALGAFSSDSRKRGKKWIKMFISSLMRIFANVIFRVLMQGAPQKVIGLEPGNICEEMQIIDGIVIQPSLSCHVEDEAEPDVKME